MAILGHAAAYAPSVRQQMLIQMENQLKTIKYLWGDGFYALFVGAAFRLAMNGFLIYGIISTRGFIQIILILFSALLLYHNIIDVFNIYFRITKAPVLFRLSEDTLSMNLAFGKIISLSYSDIYKITYEDTYKYFGWDVQIETISHSNILLNTRALNNPSLLIKTISDKNNKCHISDKLKMAFAA